MEEGSSLFTVKNILRMISVVQVRNKWNEMSCIALVPFSEEWEGKWDAYAQEDHKRAILNKKEIAGIKTMVAAIYIYIFIYIFIR